MGTVAKRDCGYPADHRVASVGRMFSASASSLTERGQMGLPWFRFYTEWADDPKVQLLSEAHQRRLAMLFCFQGQGWLATASDEDLSFKLHISLDELKKTRLAFVQKGFIGESGWSLLNWDKRQRPSDLSTPRVQKHRMKRDETVSETDMKQSMKQSETVQRRGEEIRKEENRQEERKNGARRGQANAHGDLAPLSSFFKKALPPSPLPQNRNEIVAAGYALSNIRPCTVCGEELEWWDSPTGKHLPVLAETGAVHLGDCAQKAKAVN